MILAGAAAGEQKAVSSIAIDRQSGRRNGGCIGEESYHRARSFGQKSIGKQALVTGCKSRENNGRSFLAPPIDRSTMKLAFRRSLLPAALVLAAAVPAFAHHSFAIFSMDKNVTYKGKVVEYRWLNPHSHITIKV